MLRRMQVGKTWASRPGAGRAAGIGQELLDVSLHLLRQGGAAVIHAEQDPRDLQAGVDPAVDQLNGLKQFPKSLQRQEVRLQGDQDLLRSGQGIECQKPSDGPQSMRP